MRNTNEQGQRSNCWDAQAFFRRLPFPIAVRWVTLSTLALKFVWKCLARTWAGETCYTFAPPFTARQTRTGTLKPGSQYDARLSFRFVSSAIVVSSICEQRNASTNVGDETKRWNRTEFYSSVRCQRLTNQIIPFTCSISLWRECATVYTVKKRSYSYIARERAIEGWAGPGYMAGRERGAGHAPRRRQKARSTKLSNDSRTTMDDEKLIEAVRDFECLWMVGCKAYKDIRAKENAWKEVSVKVSRHTDAFR